MKKDNLFWPAVLTVMLSLSLGGCGSKGGEGGTGSGSEIESENDSTVNSQAPQYSMTAEQATLIADNGNPDYVNISLNSTSGRREETWTYSGLKKMYVFWDGVRVKEVNITVNQNAYSNPPSVSPALFTKDTQKSDIIRLFGSNYIVDNQSMGSLSFETWYYSGQGIAVSFSGDKLVAVQTIDKS
ncbi:MAG: hypothetical protein HZC49_02750 [Nitrospirae bacterium]|nr:hypothetical protein [Nitrospirota bacterium]